MRSSLNILSVCILGILLHSGCKKTSIGNDDRIILFQYEYLSVTPGTDHNGFFIDRDGNIITFRNPSDWHFAGNDLVLTDDQLDENLKQCSYSGIRVPEEELDRYEKYIRYLAFSKVSAPRNTGAENGTSRFLCYEYSPNTGTYRGTIIKTEGAVSSENLNFYSKRIASWLKKINSTIASE